MRLKKVILGSLAVAAALTMVACGSKSADKDNAKVGIIQYAEHDALTSSRKGFLEALKDAGYEEGKNLTVTYQNAQGDQANLQTMVGKLAGENDVNFAIATPAAQALLNADSETPAVFTAVTDPVAADLVESLKKPGGNMTGTTDATDVSKQLEMLLKVVPNAKTVGIFYTSSEVNSETQAKEAKKILEDKGIKVVVKTVNNSNDVQQAMTSLANQVDAVYLPLDNTVASTAATIGDILKNAKVPAIASDEAVLSAALFTYGVDYHEIGVQAGQLAAKLLKGENPADLSVEAPKKASVAVNKDMAKALEMDTESIKNLAGK